MHNDQDIPEPVDVQVIIVILVDHSQPSAEQDISPLGAHMAMHDSRRLVGKRNGKRVKKKKGAWWLVLARRRGAKGEITASMLSLSACQ